MKTSICIVLLLSGQMICQPLVASDSFIVKIGQFSEASLVGWNEKSFKGNTSYVFKQDNGRTILYAQSKAAASGLFYEKEIDLGKTPILNWQWKINNIIKDVDETTKQGDDYPARVYVIFSGGILFWQTRAINYVWSNNQQPGSNWKNAYTENARMIAVRAGENQLGQWVFEKRNIREDYKMLFGEDIKTASAIAIMTDTDNSESYAVASYGDIYLSQK